MKGNCPSKVARFLFRHPTSCVKAVVLVTLVLSLLGVLHKHCFGLRHPHDTTSHLPLGAPVDMRNSPPPGLPSQSPPKWRDDKDSVSSSIQDNSDKKRANKTKGNSAERPGRSSLATPRDDSVRANVGLFEPTEEEDLDLDHPMELDNDDEDVVNYLPDVLPNTVLQYKRKGGWKEGVRANAGSADPPKEADLDLENLMELDSEEDDVVNDLRGVLPNTGSQDNRKGTWKGGIPLVVVEEHHDVIPHWFAAVDLGMLPRRGNTLVHIDGHPDAALPFVNSSFPFFRQPHPSELVYHMQRNDMFITSAGLTGLFSRYIWITPPWDEKLKNALGAEGYLRFDIVVGLVKQPAPEIETTGDDANSPLLCYCIDSRLSGYENVAALDDHDCYRHNNPGPSDPKGVPMLVKKATCKAEFNILAEIVTENKALELLWVEDEPEDRHDSKTNEHRKKRQAGSDVHVPGDKVPWLSEDDNVILDIDEDYYGVESAITPLQDAQINFHVITEVSEKIGRIFCAENAKQETLANTLFKLFLDALYKDFVFCREIKTCSADYKRFVNKLSTTFLTDAKPFRSVKDSMCGKSVHDTKLTLAALTEKLAPLEGRQLQALGKVGICLSQSPRTMGFDPSRGMRLCTGYNRPDNAVVQFHVPDEAELQERSKALQRLFNTKRFTPRLVTIARSVRDGYTPRGSSNKIEKDLIHTLQKVYPQISDSSIIYDKYLLGGKRGRWQ